MEYTPSCIKVYKQNDNRDIFHPEEGERRADSFAETPCFNYIMGSFSSYICIYKDVQLAWTAKTQNPPIFVDIQQFGDQKGLIVTLADNGWL